MIYIYRERARERERKREKIALYNVLYSQIFAIWKNVWDKGDKKIYWYMGVCQIESVWVCGRHLYEGNTYVYQIPREYGCFNENW